MGEKQLHVLPRELYYGAYLVQNPDFLTYVIMATGLSNKWGRGKVFSDVLCWVSPGRAVSFRWRTAVSVSLTLCFAFSTLAIKDRARSSCRNCSRVGEQDFNVLLTTEQL